MTSPWWVRPGLDIEDGRLRIAGRDAETQARELGTPSFVYDLDRFGENVRALGDAFARAGLHARQRFALKANREPEVLAALRALGGPGEPGSIGIDACSPGEVTTPWRTAGAPTRSASPARTCPSATSTCSSPPASISTSTRSARSSGSGGAPPTDRAAGQPRRRCRLSRGPRLQRRAADEVRDLPGSAR